MKRFLLLIFVTVILLSCQKKTSNKVIATIADSLNYDDSSEYLIDLQPFVYINENSLFCFNRTSNIMNEILLEPFGYKNIVEFNIGNAPSELNNPSSLTVQDNKLYFACPINRSIKSFKQNGEFIESIKVDALPFKVYNYNDSIYYSTFPNFPNFSFNSLNKKILDIDRIRENNDISPSESYVIKNKNICYMLNYTEKPHLSVITNKTNLTDTNLIEENKNTAITSYFNSNHDLYIILRTIESSDDKQYSPDKFTSSSEFNNHFGIIEYLIQINLENYEKKTFKLPKRISSVKNFLVVKDNNFFIQDSYSSIIYRCKFGD